MFLVVFLSQCAAYQAVHESELKDEVVMYRLVEPLFNAGQDSRVIRKEASSENSRTLFEARSVCIGCHAYSSAGFIALNVKKNKDRRFVVLKTDGSRFMLYDSKNIGEFSFLAWSPDSRYLAMVVNSFGVIDIKSDVVEPFDLSYRSGDIAIYDPVTKEIKLLPGASEMDFVEDMPAWSPDGKELLFVKYKAEKDAPIDSMSIYRVPFNDREGGVPVPVVAQAPGSGDYNYFPTYSPDGKWISFVKGDGSKGVFARKTSDIYIQPSAGSAVKRLSINTDGVMDSWHRWSSDGRGLVFSSKRGGDMTALYLSHVDSVGNASPPLMLSGHDNVKVNIPEFASSPAFQGKIRTGLDEIIEKIYAGGN